MSHPNELEGAIVVVPDVEGPVAAQWMVVPVPPSASVIWLKADPDLVEGSNARGGAFVAGGRAFEAAQQFQLLVRT